MRTPEIAPPPHLLLLLYGRRLLLLFTVAIGFAIAVVYVFIAPRLYEAEVVVLPATDDSGQSIGSALAQAPLLAGLIGGVQADRSTEYLAILGSQQFANDFLLETDISEELRYATFLGRTFGVSANEDVPMTVKVARFQRRVCSVTRDKTTSLISIRFHTRSPERAAELANMFIRRADGFLRARALNEANAALKFLKSESETAQQVELRQSVSTLILAWLQKKILATTRDEFAFRIVDPATSPQADDYVLPMTPLLLLGIPFLLVSCVIAGILGHALWSNITHAVRE